MRDFRVFDLPSISYDVVTGSIERNRQSRLRAHWDILTSRIRDSENLAEGYEDHANRGAENWKKFAVRG